MHVVKEECVGHVQKRIGTNLRTLKKSRKGQLLEDGLKISAKGRLTDEVVDNLQRYYGMAIRSHPNDVAGFTELSGPVFPTPFLPMIGHAMSFARRLLTRGVDTREWRLACKNPTPIGIQFPWPSSRSSGLSMFD